MWARFPLIGAEARERILLSGNQETSRATMLTFQTSVSMIQLKWFFLTLLLVLSLSITGITVNAQQGFSQEGRSPSVTKVQSKQALARAVLSEMGIAKRYDRYLDNSLGIAVSPGLEKNTKFMTWLHDILVREAGWKFVETQYAARLEANFSEAELKELLSLAKQPTMKKLLQSEIQAYLDTTLDRHKLLFKVWDDYNTGKINPPPGVIP